MMDPIRAEIFVSGRRVGEHRGGYTGFSCDITEAVSIKSLGANANLLERPISEITSLGSEEKLKWSQTPDALVIEKPQKCPSDIAIVFKITPKG
jgi:hypothetical protein